MAAVAVGQGLLILPVEQVVLITIKNPELVHPVIAVQCPQVAQVALTLRLQTVRITAALEERVHQLGVLPEQLEIMELITVTLITLSQPPVRVVLEEALSQVILILRGLPQARVWVQFLER